MGNRDRGTVLRASIVQAATIAIGDLFGTVSRGNIRVRGPLWEAKMKQTGLRVAAPEDYHLEPDSSAAIEINSFLLSSCQFCWHDRSVSGKANCLAGSLYVLAITENIRPKSTPVVPHMITGPLSMPTFAKKGQYLRVAWISIAQYLKSDYHTSA